MAQIRISKSQSAYVAPNKRPTIGLITPGIGGWYDRSVWLGIDAAARAGGANLLTFSGKIFNSTVRFQAQANVLYDLVGEMNVDGLVIMAGTLGRHVTQRVLEDFCARYRSLPVVTISTDLPGVPVVKIDNRQGIRALLHHFIDIHGYRRIAFIQGSKDLQESQERYEAYVEALSEHGISLDPRLVVPGNFTTRAGTTAVRVLFDERGLRPQLDFDALVAANDVMAASALEALRLRGLRAPHDLAVAGFDDSDEAISSVTPLTTVRQPVRALGKCAAEVVLDMLAGRDVPKQIVIPTQLVVRRSCGCLGSAEILGAIEPPVSTVHSLKQGLSVQEDQILAEMTAAATQREYEGDLKRENVKWVRKLLSAFCTEMLSDSSLPGLFMRVLSEALIELVVAQGDPAIWYEVILALRRRVLPYLDKKSWLKAENLWQQARAAIGRTTQQAAIRERIRMERFHAALHEAGAELGSACSLEELADILAQQMVSLGIPSCYLSLYEDPTKPTTRSRLFLAFRRMERLQLGSEQKVFPSHQLVPPHLLPQQEQYTMVIEPLYHREDQLGLVVFEVRARDRITCYQTLSLQISSAVRMALLHYETSQALLSAEKADQLKTRLLANVSHELRTPLNVIQGYVHRLREELGVGQMASGETSSNIEHIARSARHLCRIIDDLLDLSRAEIGELDLHCELIDPRSLLEDAFHDIMDGLVTHSRVIWRLQLPSRLPRIEADPVRLNQIVLNLLNNAHKFTEQGEIVLGASVDPPYLHIWVQDTGPGISLAQQKRIFEPFVTASDVSQRRDGIGLGLSITRRLVALHQGLVTLDSQPGQGSVFHVYMPLPNLGNQLAVLPTPAQPVVLLVSAQQKPPREIIDLSQQRGLQILQVCTMSEIEEVLDSVQPMALVLDSETAGRGEYMLFEQFEQHPALRQVPFILYGKERDDVYPAMGMAGVIRKPINGRTLLEAIEGLRPDDLGNAILIVDDESAARDLYQDLVHKGLPSYTVHLAENGKTAIEMMLAQVPSLVILDLVMPEMDGFEVLAWMRTNDHTRQVPVLILTGRALTFKDVKRLEQYASVIIHSKGILSDTEIIASLQNAMGGASALPPHIGVVVKRALAYIHQNYNCLISTPQIADAAQVSERHLQRLFRQELSLSPWQYLRRYRVSRSRILLSNTDKPIKTIAAQVGFSNQTHFARVFRKLNGLSPSAYRGQLKS